MQSIEADMAMGHQITAEVENGLGIVRPDESTNYVRSVGQRLVDESMGQPFYFSFYLRSG